MQQMVRIKTKITKDGKISLKDLPFQPGETVEVTVRSQKQLKSTKEYPLRGKPVTYHLPFKGVSEDDWESLQ
jgi:hypothetical protein